MQLSNCRIASQHQQSAAAAAAAVSQKYPESMYDAVVASFATDAAAVVATDVAVVLLSGIVAVAAPHNSEGVPTDGCAAACDVMIP